MRQPLCGPCFAQARVMDGLSWPLTRLAAAWFSPNSVFTIPGTVEAEGYKTASSNGVGALTCGSQPFVSRP